MPKAPVDENSLLSSKERNIGLSGQILPVEAIAGESIVGQYARRTASSGSVFAERIARMLALRRSGLACPFNSKKHCGTSLDGKSASHRSRLISRPLSICWITRLRKSGGSPLRQLSISRSDTISVDVYDVIEHQIVAEKNFAGPHQPSGIKLVSHEDILEFLVREFSIAVFLVFSWELLLPICADAPFRRYNGAHRRADNGKVDLVFLAALPRTVEARNFV